MNKWFEASVRLVLGIGAMAVLVSACNDDVEPPDQAYDLNELDGADQTGPGIIAQAGETVFRHEYEEDGESQHDVVYDVGNLPLIISVPHGGYQAPADIPEHCGEHSSDMYAQEIAMEIQKALYEVTGKYAHIIFNLLHRSKFDPNRNGDINVCEDDSAFEPTSTRARDAYLDYHYFINQAKQMTRLAYGDRKVLLIDLHGHGNIYQRIHLGYKLNREEVHLKCDLNELENDEIISKSTLYDLFQDLYAAGKAERFSDLVFGNCLLSLGTIMDGMPSKAMFYHCQPSYRLDPYDVNQAIERNYYDGKYIVQRHCARGWEGVFEEDYIVPGFQIELNLAIRIFGQGVWRDFADMFVNALDIYIKQLFDIDIAPGQNDQAVLDLGLPEVCPDICSESLESDQNE